MSQLPSSDVLDSSATSSGELTKNDILDLLAPTEEEQAQADGAQEQEQEEASPKKQAKPAAKEGEAEIEEEVEEEVEVEEEEEPSPEELNFVTPVRRKEILAKYPNLFKDFPYLQQAYYREQQFTEVFPTLDDAKEAHQKAQALDGFESDLMQGNFSKVLGAVKQGDPEAFNRLADNYLMELGKVDRDAVQHIIGNVLKGSIINVLKLANSQGERGTELKEAALLFNQAMFGTADIQQPSNLSKTQNNQNPEKDRLSQERQQFLKERFDTARESLSTRVQNSIKSTISNHIDPKSSMTDYVRKNAVRDAQENLEQAMTGDARFTRLMDRLWENAFKDNFSTKSLDQIRSTYLSKAKTLLPSVIQNARKEAVKAGTPQRPERDRKGPMPISGGGHTTRSSSSNNANKTPSKIPHDVKTLDFLNSDD